MRYIAMAKQEIKTDLQVYALLKEAGIDFDPQGSDIIEINNALKTASKSATGHPGYPEFVAIVKDYVLVGENKPTTAKHCFKKDGIILQDPKAICDYAVNGALWYAKHIARNTNFKKVFAFGCSGIGKSLKISPLFVDDREYCLELPSVETFYNFNADNIHNYFIREVLKEETDGELESQKLLQYAKELHEDLRNYGNLQNKEKPLVVSGILLALREREYGGFSIESLTGDSIETDGEKIYKALTTSLVRARVSPDVKKEKILSQFRIIKDSEKLNEINSQLKKTPLKKFAEFLDAHIYKPITNLQTTEDYLGRFYGEFMNYGDNDGQSLGIILTPKHITELFCDLVSLKRNDTVFDPCCGTGGFLIAAMTKMFQQTINEKGLTKDDLKSDYDIMHIREHQLHGIELQSYMFTIATTNMILRGDGRSNLECKDFLLQNEYALQLKGCDVGFMNPPYSMGSKANPELYEISFIKHLLDSLAVDGRCAVIVPQSTFASDSKHPEKKKGVIDTYKEDILRNHTLEGTIMLNKDTFYGVGTIPCIAIFRAHRPHPKNKMCKFINFEDDGYKVMPHIGLVETDSAIDKKQHLLDVWFERSEADNGMCVKSAVEATDEWLHSFFYFNDSIPDDEEFKNTVADYLTFEVSMITHGRGYLIKANREDISGEIVPIPSLDEYEWKGFKIKEIFTEVQRGKRLTKENQVSGKIPYVSSSAMNNGVDNYISNHVGVRKYENCLSLANSGSVGSCFFEPFEFVASDHITHLKNSAFSKYHYFFIATMLRRLQAKYNFNREINDARISREVVFLPIKKDGTPDYDYMDQYMRNVFSTKYREYLSYFSA